jgi:hypothetical protein
MEYLSFDSFKKLDIYNDFISKNPALGHLKIQAFTAYGAIPVEGVEILIYKDIGEYNVIFYSGKTDKNGMIDDIVLPAPIAVKANSLDTPEYTIYEMNAIHEGYETIKKYTIGMFGDINVIQYVKMTPEVILENNND